MDERQLIGRQIVVAAVCFAAGTGLGVVILQGVPRPIAGDGSLSIPAAVVAGLVAAAAFVTGVLLNPRDRSDAPRWQVLASELAAAAATVAFGGVTALGVLLGSEILARGLTAAVLTPLGGGLLTGIAAAIGGRAAFTTGSRLRTSDLAGLLFGFLAIGTLLSVLTAADPLWWRLNFSQLGLGATAWAFNGTLVIAGILIGAVGAYIGRDLHRLRGDELLPAIGVVVALWAATGIALALVGVLSVQRAPVAHNIVATGSLGLLLLGSIVTTIILRPRPWYLIVMTIGFVVLSVALVAGYEFGLMTLTVLEFVVVGFGMVWMSTLARTLDALTR